MKHALVLPKKLMHELKSIGLATLYFGFWLGGLVLLKQLVLAEYQIEINDLSKALVGTLILSKVVIVMEHVPLGRWVRNHPAWVDVLLRTGLYIVGVFVVLLLEKGFEGRHEYGGFGASLAAGFRHADVNHVWVNTICLSGALLGYNLLYAVRRRLGKGGLLQLFLTPLPEDPVEEFPGNTGPR